MADTEPATAACARCGEDAETTHMCNGLLVPPKTHHNLDATREIEWDDDPLEASVNDW